MNLFPCSSPAVLPVQHTSQLPAWGEKSAHLSSKRLIPWATLVMLLETMFLNNK